MREPKRFTPEWFRYIRFVNKWTLKDGGNVCGVSAQSWHAWEKGIKTPREENKDKILSHLSTAG